MTACSLSHLAVVSLRTKLRRRRSAENRANRPRYTICIRAAACASSVSIAAVSGVLGYSGGSQMCRRDCDNKWLFRRTVRYSAASKIVSSDVDYWCSLSYVFVVSCPVEVEVGDAVGGTEVFHFGIVTTLCQLNRLCTSIVLVSDMPRRLPSPSKGGMVDVGIRPHRTEFGAFRDENPARHTILTSLLRPKRTAISAR